MTLLHKFAKFRPALFCIHIFDTFQVLSIYVTKTQVLIICGILCCILGSYLVPNDIFVEIGIRVSGAKVTRKKSPFFTTCTPVPVLLHTEILFGSSVHPKMTS